MALVDRPFNERVLGLQVENIEPVDPCWHDQQRLLAHRRGRRVVLQQLHHLVLVDDLARRRREIFAYAEVFEIGHLDIELAVVAIQVLQHVRRPLQQVLALAFDGRLEDFGIGRREVGGRHRVDELTGIELHLIGRVGVKPLDPADRRLHALGR